MQKASPHAPALVPLQGAQLLAAGAVPDPEANTKGNHAVCTICELEGGGVESHGVHWGVVGCPGGWGAVQCSAGL